MSGEPLYRKVCHAYQQFLVSSGPVLFVSRPLTDSVLYLCSLPPNSLPPVIKIILVPVQDGTKLQNFVVEFYHNFVA